MFSIILVDSDTNEITSNKLILTFKETDTEVTILKRLARTLNGKLINIFVSNKELLGLDIGVNILYTDTNLSKKFLITVIKEFGGKNELDDLVGLNISSSIIKKQLRMINTMDANNSESEIREKCNEHSIEMLLNLDKQNKIRLENMSKLLQETYDITGINKDSYIKKSLLVLPTIDLDMLPIHKIHKAVPKYCGDIVCTEPIGNPRFSYVEEEATTYSNLDRDEPIVVEDIEEELKDVSTNVDVYVENVEDITKEDSTILEEDDMINMESILDDVIGFMDNDSAVEVTFPVNGEGNIGLCKIDTDLKEEDIVPRYREKLGVKSFLSELISTVSCVSRDKSKETRRTITDFCKQCKDKHSVGSATRDSIRTLFYLQRRLREVKPNLLKGLEENNLGSAVNELAQLYFASQSVPAKYLNLKLVDDNPFSKTSVGKVEQEMVSIINYMLDKINLFAKDLDTYYEKEKVLYYRIKTLQLSFVDLNCALNSVIFKV